MVRLGQMSLSLGERLRLLEMKLKVFAEKKVLSSLGRSLHGLKGGIFDDLEFCLIQLEMGPVKTTLTGLDLVLEMVHEVDYPIVMTSRLPITTLASDLRWQAAMGYPNVGFLHADAIDQISAIIPKLIEQHRPKDEVAISLLELRKRKTLLNSLKHNYDKYRESPQMLEKILTVAKVKLQCTEEELLKEVLSPALDEEKHNVGLFAGLYLPGVFVEVNHALLRFNVIDHDLVERVNYYSDVKPITIWHDGEVSQSKVRELREVGLPFKILPKSLFYGSTVEIVFDEIKEEHFRNLYNINVVDYRRVI